MVKRGLSTRGLSTIVVTLILILLVLVAVGILWYVFREVSEVKSDIAVEPFLVDIDINPLSVAIIPDGTSANVSLRLNRNPGEGDIDSLKFILFDGNSSHEEVVNTTLEELTEKTYMVPIGNLNKDSLETITAIPILLGKEGEQKLARFGKEYNFKTNKTRTVSSGGGGGGGGGGSGTPACTPTKTCALNYIGQCGTQLSDGCNNVLNCANNCDATQFYCYKGEGDVSNVCVNNSVTCNPQGNSCVNLTALAQFYCYYNGTSFKFKNITSTCVNGCQGNECLGPCDLTSASWNVTTATEGEMVKLTVQGNNCNGKNLNYTIYEDDGFFGADAVHSFISNLLTANWNAIYVDDGIGIPEYYFKVFVVGDASENILSNNFLEVDRAIIPMTSLTFNKISSQVYGTSLIPTCSANVVGTPILRMNGNAIISGQTLTLGAGSYLFNCSLNSPAVSNSSIFIINKVTPSLSLTANPSWSVTNPTQTSVTGSGCASGLTCNLYRNNVAVAIPDIQTLAVGIYNYVFNTTGNTNYTYTSVTNNLIVNLAAPVCGNGVIETGEQCETNPLNLNGASCVSLGYDSGTLDCSSSCQFDTTQCVGVGKTQIVELIAVDGVTVLSTYNTGNNLIQQCANDAIQGQTCLVWPGTYAERVVTVRGGIAGNYITIKSQTKGQAIINSSTNGGFTISHPYIKVDGFDITGYANAGFITLPTNTNDANRGDYAIISNNNIHDTSGGTTGPGWVNGVCTGSSCSSLVWAIRIYESANLNNIAKGVTISENNIIRHKYAAIAIFGINQRAMNNYIEGFNDALNLHFDDADAFVLFGINNTISGNEVMIDSRCENDCSNCGGSCGTDHTDYIQAYYVYDYQYYSKNMLIENNYFHDGGLVQIGQVSSDGSPEIRDWVFRNNIFARVSNPWTVYSPNISFYNNIFYKGMDERVGGLAQHPLQYTSHPTGGTGSGEVYNNIFIGNGILSSGVEQNSQGWYGAYGSASVTADYNYVSKADYTSKTGFSGEVHGIGCYPATPTCLAPTDPKFIDIAIDNFRLQAGSPAIDTGKNLAGLVDKDIDGNSRPSGDGWDIGAYEYAVSCFAGTKRCSGNLLQNCSSTGDAWNLLQNCYSSIPGTNVTYCSGTNFITNTTTTTGFCNSTSIPMACGTATGIQQNVQQCNDGNSCNGIETCDAGLGGCQAGTAPACSLTRDECCNRAQCTNENDADCAAEAATLMLWYKLDESSGSIAYDSSGNGRNGTIYNAVYTPSGRFNGAYEFNNVNPYQYIDMPDFSTGQSLTISAWIKPKRTSELHPIGMSNSQLYVVGGSLVWKPSAVCSPTPSGILQNQWNHIVLVQNSTNTIYYVNGVKTTATAGCLASSVNVQCVGGYGACQSLNGIYNFNGTIDDVKIYNRALSDSEIIALNGTIPGPQPSCDLTSGSWSAASAINNTPVTMNVYGTNCLGEGVNYTVIQKLTLFGIDWLWPDAIIFQTSGSVSTSWNAGEVSPGVYETGEYYFKAVLENNVTETVTSSDPMLNVIAAPPAPVCGNGAIGTGEQCDDGNLISGDGCSSTCQIESGSGEQIYIAQTSAGSDNGVNCANAHSVSWFNTAGNWNSVVNNTDGKISPGDIAHLCGTITSTTTIQNSGIAGNPITILFESNAKLSAPTWTNTGAIRGSSKNYIIIDGGTNGLIEATNNGEGLTYQQADSVGMDITSSNNIEIKNLRIDNIYVKIPDSQDYVRGSRTMVITDSNNVKVHNMNLSDAEYAVRLQTLTTNSNIQGVEFYNNTAQDFATFMTIAVNNNYNYSNIHLYSNKIIGTPRWGENPLSGDGIWHHRDGLHTWTGGGGATGVLKNLSFEGNHFSGNFGKSETQTALVYITDIAEGVVINNNIFDLTDSLNEVPALGVISLASGIRYIDNILIANNDFRGKTNINIGKYAIDIQPGSATNIKIFNNIINTFYLAIYFESATTNSPIADNNIYFNNPDQIFRRGATWYTLSQWQTYLGGCPGTNRECNSQISNPLFVSSTDSHLQSTSPAIDTGKNLAGIVDNDFDGNSRPSGAGWDIGAYEYQTPIQQKTQIVERLAVDGVSVLATYNTGNNLIQQCANAATQGQTCLVWPGTYSERVSTVRGGSPGNYITIKSQTKGAAIINSPTNGGFTISHPYIKIDGFDITGYIDIPYPRANSFIRILSGGNYAIISNNNIHDTMGGTAGPGWVSGKCTSGNNCYQEGYAIEINPDAFPNIATGVTITGNTISRYKYLIMPIYGTNHTITSNKFTGFNDAINLNYNDHDIMNVFGTGHIISGNEVYNFDGQCIDSCANCAVGCANQHTDFVQSYANCGSAACYTNKYITVENNYVHDLKGAQIGQISTVTATPGVYSTEVSDWTFRNNIFTRISDHFNIFAPRINFYNNIFYKTGDARIPGANAQDVLQYQASSHGIGTGEVYNNFFIGNAIASNGQEMNNVGWYLTYGAGASITADYNYVSKADFTPKTGFSGEVHGIGCYPATATCLAAQDPKFIDIAIDNFHLLSSSPVIDKGKSLAGLVDTDKDGVIRPQGAAWDIGAYEYY